VARSTSGRSTGSCRILWTRLRDGSPTGPLEKSHAGLTPYHAIEASRDALRPGATCVVIGVGGLGHLAAQILAGTTDVRIVAVDVDERHLAIAAELVADHTLTPGPEAAEEIRALVGLPPAGADVVLDFVSVDDPLGLGAEVVSTGGRLTLVGLGGGTVSLTVGIAPAIPLEARLEIPFWTTRAKLAEVFELARRGDVVADVETFADASEAYRRLRQGQGTGRGSRGRRVGLKRCPQAATSNAHHPTAPASRGSPARISASARRTAAPKVIGPSANRRTHRPERPAEPIAKRGASPRRHPAAITARPKIAGTSVRPMRVGPGSTPSRRPPPVAASAAM
jgi:Zinc-binding dehydrogenase